jgi:hypothetical protein
VIVPRRALDVEDALRAFACACEIDESWLDQRSMSRGDSLAIGDPVRDIPIPQK